MFLINWGYIKGRIDPFYYKIDYRALEEAVLKNTKYKLRDFILYMAGGATPKKDQKEKYYADKSGIPFVRVQNLTPEGLDLSECVFINEQTHNNMLSRSKVQENDLLVKITGVGRMAVSSVAPQQFEGNINQHMVVIKTKDRQTSELVAAYLNSDIGESWRPEDQLAELAQRWIILRYVLFPLLLMQISSMLWSVPMSKNAKKNKKLSCYLII